MDEKTVTLIERPFLEIVDDILTAIVGGVVNEEIIFDLKIEKYPLSQPAADIRGITGKIKQNGDVVHHVFRKEVDYFFSPDDNAVIWEGGEKPADETIFYVDYFRPEGQSQSPLSDINVGSVTRTLSEAIGREIAVVYQQINQAYLAGFIDTATGKSLDLVVSILGVQRQRGDSAVGFATFFRDPAVSGTISVIEGTRLIAPETGATFQTTQPRTLQQGQVRIDVPIRATEEFTGDAGQVAAGAISATAQPIAGINRVTNFDPTILGTEDESDEDLRLRAKARLRALGKATLAALELAIRQAGAELIETWDPNTPVLSKRSDPGKVLMQVATEPERFASLRSVVEQTRAAGVQTTLVALYIFFTPRMVVTVKPGIAPAGKDKLKQQIIDALQAYVDGLGSGDPATGEALLDAITGADEVNISEARIVDVITSRLDVSKPAEESLVDAILEALADAEDQRQAIASVVAEEQPALLPTGRRTPDRTLVEGLSGDPVTDEELEKGEFQVVAQVDGDNWWLVLDVAPADIALVEEGG